MCRYFNPQNPNLSTCFSTKDGAKKIPPRQTARPDRKNPARIGENLCRKYNTPPRRQNFFGLQDGAGWSVLGWLSLQNGQKKSDVQLEFVPHDQLEGAVARGTGGVKGDAGDGDEGIALAER